MEIIPASELEFLQKGFNGSYLTYIRDTWLMQALDKKFGDEWTKDVRVEGGCVICTITDLKRGISRSGCCDIISQDAKNREDIKYRTAETGAFKRACSSWGLGKILYRFVPLYLDIKSNDKSKKKYIQSMCFIKLCEFLYKLDTRIHHEDLFKLREEYLSSVYLEYCLEHIKTIDPKGRCKYLLQKKTKINEE